MKQLFTLNDQGGWAPALQGMFFIAAVSLICRGAGRLSVGRNGRWNQAAFIAGRARVASACPARQPADGVPVG
jgi:hypothetical protein